MKFIVTPAKPRNPVVAAAMRRHAGSHRSGHAAQRQQGARALRQELHQLKPSP